MLPLRGYFCPSYFSLAPKTYVNRPGFRAKRGVQITRRLINNKTFNFQLAMPVRVKAVHIINYSWILNSFFYVFKKFIPQHAWEYIHFHGNDLKSLQKHLDQEVLPPRYGGKCRAGANFGVWLKKIKKYRDEQFDREMKQLGYVIKEWFLKTGSEMMNDWGEY